VHDIQQRLIKCFAAVFPELSTEEIVKANSDGTNNWDSLSQVTLLAVVQEEFGVDFDVNSTDSCISFEGILARIREAARSRIPAESLHISHHIR